MENIYSADDFAQQSMKLLPEGLLNKNPDSNLYQLVSTLAEPHADLQQQSAFLLTDGFPATTYYLLPEWEETLGLPDPCQGVAPTIQQRQAQVVARFAGVGGSSISWLYQFAYNLGFLITITEYSSTIVGGAEPFITSGSNFTFMVNYASTNKQYFSAGKSSAGQPLWTDIAGAVLECEINTVKPAICQVYYNAYSPGTYTINPVSGSYSVSAGGNIAISGSYSNSGVATWATLSQSTTIVPVDNWIETTTSGNSFSVSYPVPASSGTYNIWVVDANNQNPTMSGFSLSIT